MGRASSRYPVEMAYKLDTVTLRRHGFLRPGKAVTGRVRWHSAWGDEDEATVTTDLTRLPELSIEFEGTQQDIPLLFTRQPFGGVRWWLLCPVTGQLCRALYLPEGGDRFASRQAYGLIYRSQQLSRHGRALRRIQKLADELDCDDWGQPERPKGMWRRTFKRKADELARAQSEVARALP